MNPQHEEPVLKPVPPPAPPPSRAPEPPAPRGPSPVMQAKEVVALAREVLIFAALVAFIVNPGVLRWLAQRAGVETLDAAGVKVSFSKLQQADAQLKEASQVVQKTTETVADLQVAMASLKQNLPAESQAVLEPLTNQLATLNVNLESSLGSAHSAVDDALAEQPAKAEEGERTGAETPNRAAAHPQPVTPPSLEGWLYLGRINKDTHRWKEGPFNIKHVSVAELQHGEREILTISGEPILRMNRAPGVKFFSQSPQAGRLADGDKVRILKQDLSNALDGSAFLWVKVQLER
jgi:hypothetical protein